jgi:hypothetical protein
MGAGEIRYDYHALADSAKAIEREAWQARSFDTAFLSGLQADIDDHGSFRSDYADMASETLTHMKGSRAENLAGLLEEYAVALAAAGELMKDLEEKAAEGYSKEEDAG